MDNFIRHSFEKVFNVEKIITIFYMEFSKDFFYDGESHNFWEIVYIDKGEMICTADKKQFTLKGGELTFHKPNEFHNLSSNKTVAPNVSIITFECKSKAMQYFEGKIIKLTAEEKGLLSMLFAEGLSCFELADKTNPLLQELKKIENAPFGSSQLTKIFLEAFLIKLCRNQNKVNKKSRLSFKFKGLNVPYEVKEIDLYLKSNLYNKLSLPQIAIKLGKSRSAIKAEFSKYYGCGVIKRFNYLKIEEAKKLIRESTFNFTQIAEALKFDNLQYFSTCFKSFTKMTPTEYKNSITAL